MFLEAIFLTQAAGQPMIRVREVQALAGRGLEGDRYTLGTGYYSRRDPCQLTLIEGEALDLITVGFGLRVKNGEHRRNLVTRGIRLRELEGKRLRVGEVLLEFERPRPPCGYMERITQPGMTRALGEGSGIGVRVLTSGLLHEGAAIVVEAIEGARAPRVLP